MKKPQNGLFVKVGLEMVENGGQNEKSYEFSRTSNDEKKS